MPKYDDMSGVAKRRPLYNFDQARTCAKKRAEDQFPPLPAKGKEEMEAMLADAVGDVVYGAAAVDGAIFLRTGTELYCVRERK